MFSRLSFTAHVKLVAVNAGRLVGVIMRLRNLIPEKVKLQLYKSTILPHLTYCSVMWHVLKASDTLKLETIQEKALRTIYRDSVSSYIKIANCCRIANIVESKTPGYSNFNA